MNTYMCNFEIICSIIISYFCFVLYKNKNPKDEFFVYCFTIWNIIWALTQSVGICVGGILMLASNVLLLSMTLYYKTKNFSLFDFKGFYLIEVIKDFYKKLFKRR